MISINNIAFSYPGNKKVLHQLNLDIQTGMIHGMVGLNGSGKTTLLNLIFGLLKPDEGVISCDNFDMSKQNMGYLPSESYFYSNITGREYLALFKNPGFETEIWNQLFGLPLDEIVDEYSSGMKKKLALMGVIKMDKQLLILDEPFNNLDIETSRVVRKVLIEMRKSGKTILVTSHILETLTNLCDRIHYLNEGKILLSREKKDFAEFQETLFSSVENKTAGIIDEIFRPES